MTGTGSGWMVALVTMAMVVVSPGTPPAADARIPVAPGAVSVVVPAAPAPADRTTPAVDLDWPVEGVVVAAFDPPATPYGPGHRGVDLAVARGDPVAAMGAGRVGFAGFVAGRAWVSVDHAGGLRTTVGPMATVGVTAGDVVAGGDLVGTAAATAHATAEPRTGRLHVSARVTGDYVDPASLVGQLVATLLARPDQPDGPVR